MDWKTIETAPKDGTVILLGHSQAVFDGYWSDHERGWVDDCTNAYGDLVTYNPTHWAPLPPPPRPDNESTHHKSAPQEGKG